ncbi:vacuolar-type H+-ATPase subunit H [Marmoricola sp. URHA0025 HA25]
MRTRTPSKKSLTDQASDLVEQMTPHVEAARERFVNDVLPVAQSVLADARETAREVAKDARAAAEEAAANAEKSSRKSRKKAAKRARAKAGKMAAAAAAAAPVAAPLADRIGEKVGPKPKRRKRFLLLAVLAGVGAVVLKKVRGGAPSGTSYVPPRPAPTPRPAASDPVSTATPPPAPPESHFEPDPLKGTTDIGGAGFDEVAADAAEGPQPVTTPDQPAEVEDVSEDARHARKS